MDSGKLLGLVREAIDVLDRLYTVIEEEVEKSEDKAEEKSFPDPMDAYHAHVDLMDAEEFKNFKEGK